MMGLPFFMYCASVSAWRPKASRSMKVTSSFDAPGAVHREPQLGDGHALGSVAQFGIARQVPDQDDFVIAGHAALTYFASAFGAIASVNITRNTSSFSAN